MGLGPELDPKIAVFIAKIRNFQQQKITHASLWGSDGTFGIIYKGSILSRAGRKTKKIYQSHIPKMQDS